MLDVRQREEHESARLKPDGRETGREERDDSSAAEKHGSHGPALRAARLLFGGVLAFMALDDLRTLDESVQYAESKGAPLASVSVPLVSSSLFLGGLGIALWRLPALAATAAAAFFLGVTPVMHDFWAIADPEEAQGQQIHFLKNAALLGATLGFRELGRREMRG